MSKKTAQNDTNEMKWGIDIELSDRELWCIGKIVALWGSLEHEIFLQTLKCFSGKEISKGHLPREMNNVQFSQVLALWEAHVVNKAAGKRKEVLQEQHRRIHDRHDFRNALVHGMWDWSKSAPEKITATRIRKRQVIRTHFTADDLASFASDLEEINFKVRFPGGLEDYADSMMKQGAHVSRRFLRHIARS
jgi:hypothetical protein